MKFIFLLLFTLIFQTSWSQKYAIVFDGDLDTTLISQMENDCEQFQSVYKAHIQYKFKKAKGELIIQLDPEEKNKRGEDDNHFSVAEIKAYLISKKLSPVSFITLEN